MLRFAKDRLYLVERDDGEEEDEDDGDTTAPVQSRRILVLSLQGDILQVVTHPTEPTAVFTSICCFDRKLLASYMYYRVDCAIGIQRFTPQPRREKKGMLALQGL